MIAATLLLAFSCLGVPAQHETSIFGEPLFVNDKRVSDDEIKLALIYGPCRQALEMRKTELVIEDEIAREVKEGTSIAVLRVRNQISDEAFEAEYKYMVDDFKMAYPDLELGAEICRSYRSVDWYRDYLRQQMRFDRIFLPDDPADWPTTTLEAVKAEMDSGEQMLADAKESYKTRLEKAHGDPSRLPRAEDPLLLQYMRMIVRELRIGSMGFKTQPDIGDPKLALWADTNGDGKPELTITINELWDKVSDTVTETEVQEAKQGCITALATRERLAGEGALLSRKEGEEALVDLTTGFGGMTITLEQLATRTFCFPSVESFSEYYVLKKSFERSIASKLADGPKGELSPALAAYLPRANQTLGLGMVDCEVLLVSAMDIPRFRWKKDGWSLAKRKAEKLRGLCDQDSNFENWTKLREANCEYWDPPAPTKGTNCAERKEKGRFGNRYRNDLISFVGETAYSEWVTGECITDRMFYDQPEGSVAGPYRGPLGWYLTRVQKRTPPSRPLKLDNTNHRLALRDDYLRSAFIQYSKEAVAEANVRGFQPL